MLKSITPKLNIELIFLPPYSPKQNPIEQFLRIIKRRLSCFYFETTSKLINLFKDTFYDITDNENFYENWVKKFLNKIFYCRVI